MIVSAIGALENPDDRRFMENLYLDFERLMFSTAQKYNLSLPDQRDVVQDSLEKLIKKVATLRPMKRCTLSCYIVYTIRSTSIDFLRTQKRLASKSVSIDAQDYTELEATAPSLEDLIISGERQTLLPKLWPCLPEEDRILLEGKYLWGYTDAELAFQLNCQPNSIRMKLTRARRRALAYLENKEEV